MLAIIINGCYHYNYYLLLLLLLILAMQELAVEYLDIVFAFKFSIGIHSCMKINI